MHHLTVDLRTVDLRTGQTGASDSRELTTLLFHALREILFNVVKHAKVPTAWVEVTRRDGEVQIVVSDTGAGFDASTLRVGGGAGGGFGLVSIRQRLELLGGRLEIASTPGQGSRLTLRAPLQGAMAIGRQTPGPREPDRSGAGSAVGAREAPDRPGKIRILVVDDHKVVRQGLIRLLKGELDLEIVGEAADGQTAVTLTRQLLPDVVTMDVSLPGMNGIEATRIIHAECPSVRVIGLSMFEEAEQAEAMRAAGAVDYLTKSDASDALIEAIRMRCKARGAGEVQQG